MSKQYITEIIKDEYKIWNKGNLILIHSGTGTGKSYFIKNILNSYAQNNNKNILYLTNRNNLKNQIIEDIQDNNNSITIMNYQKIESLMLQNTYLDNFDYVVMDECHYFFSDAGFSIKTNLFFEKMLEDSSICKILISATPKILLNYFKDNEIEITYTYELKTDYSYVNKIIAFNNYESIDSIIESISQNEQILLFSSAKKSYEIAKKYNGAFICSEYNNRYNKYISHEELDNIIINGTFNSHLLCCTTALDNGINIKEGTPIKHIIIDILDRDEFIQCLGRKRVNQNETVNLYFYSYNDNKRINGFKRKIINTLDRADILINEGQVEYVNRKFKNDRFVDDRIIDEFNDEYGHTIKKVNQCIYNKYKADLLMYNAILDKNYPTTYKSIIALNLGVEENMIEELEVKEERLSLEDTLDSLVGKRLFKEEQKELKMIFKEHGLHARTMGINTLNGNLQDRKLPFIIQQGVRKSYRDDEGKVKKERSHWIIGKIVYK